jgi:hypothetical protein
MSSTSSVRKTGAAGILSAVLVALASTAHAQTAGEGVVFGGIGGGLCGCNPISILHLGGGGEVVVTEHVGIGGELGVISPFEALDDHVGLASLNASYRFGERGKRTRAFVTGGYTMLFREGAFNAVNAGGGVDRWLSDRVGVRFEARDHMPLFHGAFDVHYLDVRVGLVFR